MQFVDRSATMSVVLFVFCVGLVRLVGGNICFNSRCDVLIGYNDEMVRFYFNDVFNFTQLIAYCRNPNRQDYSQCNTASECNVTDLESQTSFYRERIQLYDNAFDYICSKVDVLDRDRICLIRTTRDVTQCWISSFALLVEEYRVGKYDHVTPDSWRIYEARYTRRSTKCVYGLLNEQCNSELGKVFGNFLYGVSELIYDEENMGKL